MKPEYVIETDFEILGFDGDNAFLSNFYPANVEFERHLYPTAEHAYQAAKSIDPRVRLEFLGVISPSKAKKLGRTLELRSDWETVKYDIMLQIVFDKFLRNKELRQKLVATAGKYLEETNHWGDTVWGVDATTNIGTNWLGMILMDVRKCFKSSSYFELLKK